MKNLIDVTTRDGRGQFKRHLRKLNAADRNLEKSHKMTFSDRYCDMKRCKKWRSIRNKILSQVSFPKKSQQSPIGRTHYDNKTRTN